MSDMSEPKAETKSETETVTPLPAGCQAVLLDGAWSCARCGSARPMNSAHPGCKPQSLSRLRAVVDAAVERHRDEYSSLRRIANDAKADPAIRSAINPWPAAVRAAELAGVAHLLDRINGNDKILDELMPSRKKAGG